jgi:hypothetical protein
MQMSAMTPSIPPVSEARSARLTVTTVIGRSAL